MTQCKDCEQLTDRPYCAGNSDRLCKSCADKRVEDGNRGKIITIGLLEVTTEWELIDGQ